MNKTVLNIIAHTLFTVYAENNTWKHFTAFVHHVFYISRMKYDSYFDNLKWEFLANNVNWNFFREENWFFSCCWTDIFVPDRKMSKRFNFRKILPSSKRANSLYKGDKEVQNRSFNDMGTKFLLLIYLLNFFCLQWFHHVP